MEKLSNIADSYFRWMRPNCCSNEKHDESTSANECRSTECSFNPLKRILIILENILLWENPVNSIYAVIVFNLTFWSAILLDIRGFITACGFIFILVLYYSIAKAQTYKLSQKVDEAQDTLILQTKTEEKINALVEKCKLILQSLQKLRKDQPGVFCLVICALSLYFWLLGSTVNEVFLAYTSYMSILICPGLIVRASCRIEPPKEWDSEIEDFLPAVTEDNLQVLTRAGDSGDHSPTPINELLKTHVDPLDDEELVGLKMPSHEDGSTDGLEISESELSPEVVPEFKSDVKLEEDIEFDVNFKRGYFERSSSSEEEAELQPHSEKLPSHDDDSDNDFEMIDAIEITNIVV